MTQTEAISAIALGTGMIVVSFFIKSFYAARSTISVSLSNRKIATWKGRLLFISIGTVMIIVGASYFVVQH